MPALASAMSSLWISMQRPALLRQVPLVLPPAPPPPRRLGGSASLWQVATPALASKVATKAADGAGAGAGASAAVGTAPGGPAAGAAHDGAEIEEKGGKEGENGGGEEDKVKENGAGKEKGGSAKGGGKEKEVAVLDVSRVDLRVGLITKVERHPDADSLYVEEIDLGEPTGPRTVVSGLVKFVPIEEMQNRKVCLVCNLKPTALRGVKSYAMVLAASNADHTKVELLNPPTDAAPGDRISVEGFSGEPDAQLNPKRKVWEAVKVDLRTNEKGVACFRGVPLRTSQGECTVASLGDSSIG